MAGKLMVLVLAALLSSAGALAAQPLSFRERLIEAKIRGVTPLGDHYTMIGDGAAVWNAYPGLARIGLEMGGVPEVLITSSDPFTKKESTEWVRIELFEKGGEYFYYHPVTGKQQPFGYGEMYEFEEVRRGIEYPPLVRMRGVFEMVERYMADPVRQSSTTIAKVTGYLLLFHPQRQPFVYGNVYYPAEKLLEPPPGLEDVSEWRFVAPDSTKEKFKKGLGMAAKVMGLSFNDPGIPDSQRTDHFYFGYGAFCARQGYTPTFLLRSASGSLERPSPERILAQVASNSATRGTDLYLSCPSEAPFTVAISTDAKGEVKATRRMGTTMEQISGWRDPEQPDEPWKKAATTPIAAAEVVAVSATATHSSPSESRALDQSAPQAQLASADTLSGRLEQLQQGQAAASPAASEGITTVGSLDELRQALGALQLAQGAGVQPQARAGAAQLSVEDALALQAAALRSTVRKEAGSNYAGLYHGMYQGCDHVSTIQNWRDLTPATARTPQQEQVIWNYLVCAGQIAEKQLTRLPGTRGLPDQVGEFAQQVARDARNYGVAEASVGLFTVRGYGLRDQTGCQVDLRYFKGLELLAQELRDGCQ
ncbi:hypothetical protein [Geoalkalibacter sp.]|uniref:hypothetical protein n=1 Tax=Geoalkalibacter sp. TaxID=3041440 RepID=UPI00272EB40A|nr:hypothetical protein [Geoalkalibacter sp.]